MDQLPPPPPVEGRLKRLAKKVAYPYGKQTSPPALLRSRLRPGETEFTQARGWEKVASSELEILMLVTDQRIIWTYTRTKDVVLDIEFAHVVAFLGSEGEGGLIIEADEPRYEELATGQTTLARFRLRDRATAVAIVRFVEERVPVAARDLIPDVEGTGRHESYSSYLAGGGTAAWTPVAREKAVTLGDDEARLLSGLLFEFWQRNQPPRNPQTTRSSTPSKACAFGSSMETPTRSTTRRSPSRSGSERMKRGSCSVF